MYFGKMDWNTPITGTAKTRVMEYMSETAMHALHRGELFLALRGMRQLRRVNSTNLDYRRILQHLEELADEARSIVDAAQDDHPNITPEIIARARFALGDLTEAAKDWLAIAQKSPDNLEAYLNFARCMVLAGNGASIEGLLKDLEASADHPAIHGLNATRALATHKETDYILHANKAIQAYGADALPWLPFGAAISLNAPMTPKDFERYKTMDIAACVIHLYTIAQSLQKELLEDCIRLADQLLTDIPDDVYAASLKTVACIKSKRPVDALRTQNEMAKFPYVGVEALRTALPLMAQNDFYAEVASIAADLIAIYPEDDMLAQYALYSYASTGDFDKYAPLRANFQARLDDTVNVPKISPFATLPLTDDPMVQRRIATGELEHFIADTSLIQSKVGTYKAGEKIRIGYYSNDFQQHATLRLLTEILELNDKSRFSLHAYSYSDMPEDAARQRVKAAVDSFTDVANCDDYEIVEKVRADNIHILVDLKGFTRGGRLAPLRGRMAPIQVAWLGYPGTYGIKEVDYVIGDAYVTPKGDEAQFSENPVRMPHSYQPNDRKRDVAKAPTHAEVGLPENALIFASFNQTYKIQHDVFTAWMDILKAVPNSVLWLLVSNREGITNLCKHAEKQGVSAERLYFAPYTSNAIHLARYHLVDLALDTAPVGSHTTASDALWVGAPVLALRGGSFVSRVSASLVSAAGLPELICNSLDEYKAKAIALASNPDKLKQMRQHLVSNRMSVPLFNSELFTRHLERAYEMMIERLLKGEKPAPFDVPA